MRIHTHPPHKRKFWVNSRSLAIAHIDKHDGLTPYPIESVAHLAWKKGSVTEGQLLISLFSMKLHFLLRLEIYRWTLRCYQSIILAKFCRYTVYQQYLLIKAATLVLCTECSETRVATSSKINANSLYCSLWHAALRLHQVVRNIQTTPQSSQ